MRFERTKGSIANLSSGDISANDLLDMLVRTTQDVFEANHITKATALEVTDQSALIMNLYNLANTLLALFMKNQDGLSSFPSFIQGKIRSAETELEDKEAVLSVMNTQIREEEAVQKKLRCLLQNVESRRGHLLSVREECESLRARIEELNDPRLDKMGLEKTALEKDLAERKEKYRFLTDKTNGLRQELDEWTGRIATLQDNIRFQTDELGKLKTKQQEKQTELSGLEDTVRQAQGRLAQLQTELEELPQKHTDCLNAYREARNRVTIICNAVNSARNDTLLRENLFSKNQGSLPLPSGIRSDLAVAEKEIADWESLNGWLGNMEQRIFDLLEVYRGAAAEMVERAENLTAEKDQ